MIKKGTGRGGYAGLLLNQPEALPFVEQIGRLIVNCGAIELLSILWLSELATDQTLVDVAIELPFRRRVELVIELIPRTGLAPDVQAEAVDAWQAAIKHAETRNVIAHGPLAFGWHGEPDSRPADYIGVPSLRHLKSKHGGKVPIAPIEGLREAVDHSVAVGTVLGALLDKLVQHNTTNLRE